MFLSLLHPLPLLAPVFLLPYTCYSSLVLSWFFGASPAYHSSAGKAPTRKLSLILISPDNALGTLMLLDQTLLPLSQTTDSRQGLQTELEIKELVFFLFN